jgi:hypothetical protein
LFDKNASYALFGGYLNNVIAGQDTRLNSYNGGDKTIIIKVAPNTTYTVTRATNLGSVYDRIRCAAFTTLPVDSSSGVILCNYMNTTQASATFTTLSDTQYVAINVRNSGAVGDDWTQFVDAFQLEIGSTATAYEPYYDGGTATTEMLLKVGDYKDVQEIISGAVTRNVGVIVLDGTEGWQLATATDLVQFYTSSTQGVIANNVSLTSTIAPYGCTVANRTQYDFGCYSGNSGNLCFQMKGSATLTTATAWAQWLVAQYNAGTPVIVVYPLATPTVESVAGQPLQTTDGDNVLEITQASIDDLELEAEYEKEAE